MKKAVIIAFDNFTDIDVFLPWDLLNRVKIRDKSFAIKIIGTAPSHRSSCGIDVATHGLLEEAKDADLVFFASGRGAREACKDAAFLQRLQLNSNEQLICSICSGALILAALGHLDGLTATTYPSAAEALRGFGVEVLEDKHLVTHGNIATAAGCLAAVDLMSWAIEKIYNTEMKEAVIASVLPVGQGQVCLY